MNTFNVYEHSFILFHIYNVYNEIILANQLHVFMIFKMLNIYSMYIYQMDIFFFLNRYFHLHKVKRHTQMSWEKEVQWFRKYLFYYNRMAKDLFPVLLEMKRGRWQWSLICSYSQCIWNYDIYLHLIPLCFLSTLCISLWQHSSLKIVSMHLYIPHKCLCRYWIDKTEYRYCCTVI